MNARSKGEAGVGVAKVVEADARQPGVLGEAFEQPGEAFGVDWGAVWLAEDEVVVLEVGAEHETLFELPCPV